MFRLSQSAGYALRALSCLDPRGESVTSIAFLAKRSGVPRPYLSKVIRRLVSIGLLFARRGRGGGVRLERRADRISLLDVARAFEQEEFLRTCILGGGPCRRDPRCPLHGFWVGQQRQLEQALARHTLADLIQFERRRWHGHAHRGRRVRLCE